MKKLLCILLCGIMLTATAFADVAVEPYGNDFYMKHMDDCTFVNQNYYVTAPEGYVTMWETPEAKKNLRNFENGELVFISVEYGGWGATEYRDDAGNWFTGWVSMDRMTERYESRHFSAEFETAIFEDESLRNALESYDCTGDGVYFYSYPCSGETDFCITTGDFNAWKEFPSFEKFYKDEEGRTWGFVGYYFGIKSKWVCIDDPENPDIPCTIDRRPELLRPKQTPAPSPTPSVEQAEPIRAMPLKSKTPYIAVGAAAVAVVAAALLIYKKRKA